MVGAYVTHGVRRPSEARGEERTKVCRKLSGGLRQPNKATAHRHGGARGAGAHGAVGWRANASIRKGMAGATPRPGAEKSRQGVARFWGYPWGILVRCASNGENREGCR